MFGNLRDRLPIIGSKKQVVCPRCLNTQLLEKNQDGQICDADIEDEFGQPIKCGYEFPLLYIRNSGEAEPVPVQVFGWTMHGKTVFLNVLRLTLMEMKRVWENYSYQSITRHDLALEQELRVKIKNGIMPDSTQLKGRLDNEVYIMQLNHMMRWGSRFLIIMDHAGERFDIRRYGELAVHEIPFLTHEKTTTLMIVSVPMLRGDKFGTGFEASRTENSDLRPEERGGHYGLSMDQLLNMYIEAMTRYDVRQQRQAGLLRKFVKPRRKIVVVLTMADKFVHDLPPKVRDYLIEDNMWDRLYRYDTNPMSNADMEAYMEKLLEISQEIQSWLRRDIDKAPGGAQLVALLEKNNIETRFCIISATGHDGISNVKDTPDKRREMGIEISPRRVLDPLFWVMEYQDS